MVMCESGWLCEERSGLTTGMASRQAALGLGGGSPERKTNIENNCYNDE